MGAMIAYDEAICRDLHLSSSREWLETDGLGGYASSTICGMNTRRYHGLLVAATRPPVGRMVLLSKIEETLTVNGKSYELSVNRYPGVVHPAGHLYLKQFRLDPFPVFLYEMGGIQLEKSILMLHGENATVIRYELRGQPVDCVLELRPLIAFRDYHATTHENSALDPAWHAEATGIRFTPYRDLPSLYLAHECDEVRESGVWFRSFEYDRERERGLDYREDLFQPCVLVANLGGRTRLTLIASTEPHDVGSADRLRDAELKRRQGIIASSPGDRPFVQALVRAADQFLVKRGDWTTVIAGYHWFSDWGRDTMIALPGLTLTTKRPEVARRILLAFAASVDRGMLPNRFPDSGETPEYNTVDATLWFTEAVRAYLAYTSDLEFVRAKLYDVLADIVAWHVRGTRYGIRVGPDGLITAGEPGVQLTWMDAKVGDWVVTPRLGKPVEIQALWYNAVRVMEDLARRLARDADQIHYRELAERAAANFTAQFWNSSAGCLYDVVNGDERDAAIRPNQILAVSLPYKMLNAEQASRVVDTVERHLLTPFGLRTLSPSDPQYHGRYEGDQRSRDAAYHQGTVWPWLMGPFLKAYIETRGGSAESRAQASAWLAGLAEYIGNQGVGQLPEIFSGDTPHQPAGCIAQAWTVAELLRVCMEDVYRLRP
jgi:predicted glycogen debranching enzyme